jgi:hypothetical protein
MPISDADRRRSFEEISAAKGMPIHFSEPPSRPVTNVHLDLNMVDQVIKDAIIEVDNLIETKTDAPTDLKTLQSIKAKFMRLLDNGSTYEKVTFAFSRGRYIFPEDVALLERSAVQSTSRMSSVHTMDCQTICNYICNCICDPDSVACQQFCEYFCHDICNVS